MDILLSKVTTPIIGWISELLGLLMNGIYVVLNSLGTEKVGFAILIYTVVVYMIMLPITLRTQKQSKLQSYMQPEINKIQSKYKGRRDSATQMKMSQEMQGVYAKYGFSPYGTCLPLLVQMLLLFGVYQVIYHIPGYVSKIGNVFTDVANKIVSSTDLSNALSTFISENSIRVSVENPLTQANVIDTLYLLKPTQWTSIIGSADFSSISTDLSALYGKAESVNWFMGMNISMSPWDVIQDSWATHSWGFLIIAIAIPVLAWFTQWIGIKLQPSQAAMTDNSPTANTMKSMNLIMPLFSAFICCTLSLGVAIYWIAGAVIRAVQMVIINRRMMKWDMDAIIAKNVAKAEEKRKKGKKTLMEKLTGAGANTKNETDTNSRVESARLNERAHTSRKNTNYGRYTNNAKGGVDYSNIGTQNPDSMFYKVNMVNKYNEEHVGSTNKNLSGKKKKKRS